MGKLRLSYQLNHVLIEHAPQWRLLHNEIPNDTLIINKILGAILYEELRKIFIRSLECFRVIGGDGG